jgi:hypothetical protein
MACRKLYDVKRVGYQSVASANYMDALGSSPALQEILVQSDIVIDTKGELATYKILNATKYVDDRNDVIRQKGSIKFTRNLGDSMFGVHKDLINAGLGEFLSAGTAANTSIITTGKGGPISGSDEFNVKSGSAMPVVGQLVHISGYGFRVVTEIDTLKFSVDRPIDTAIATETSFDIADTYKMHNPKGTCDKSFNVVVQTHDGEYIVAMGCNCNIEFALNFDKQLTLAITFTSPDITLVNSGLTPTFTAESTIDQPWICNFSESIYVNSLNAEASYFPQSIDLGRSITEEPLMYPGGRNNIRGYLNRVSFKPVFKLDIDTVGKVIRGLAQSYDSIIAWSFKQTQFGIYMNTCKGAQVDHTTNNSNHDAVTVNYDVNHRSDSVVMFGYLKH